MVFRLGSGRFIWRSGFQWQPTLTVHDPNPPITIETAPEKTPFVERRRLLETSAWWLLEPPAQQQRKLFVHAGTAAPVNDPPFGSKLLRQQAEIANAWHRWRRQGAAGGGVLAGAPEKVPFNRAATDGLIARAWYPDMPMPQQALRRRVVSVDNPVFDRRYDLGAILQAWEPAAPQPHVKIPKQIVSVDNPPFGQRAELPDILRAWESPPAQPQARRPTQIVSVDPPPPRGPDWLSTVLRGWQEPAPDRQIRVFVPQLVAAAPADDPPFGSRQSALSGILAVWSSELAWQMSQRQAFLRHEVVGPVAPADIRWKPLIVNVGRLMNR